VARELEMGEAQLRAEYVRLAELLAGESPPPGSSFPSNVSSTPEAPLTPLMHQADALPDSIRVLAHPSSPEGRGQSDAEELRARVEALTRTLAARIRAGEADEGAFHDAAYKHVERTVIEKLEIANPRYLQKLGATRDGE
jgi:hypothetical protein